MPGAWGAGAEAGQQLVEPSFYPRRLWDEVFLLGLIQDQGEVSFHGLSLTLLVTSVNLLPPPGFAPLIRKTVTAVPSSVFRDGILSQFMLGSRGIEDSALSSEDQNHRRIHHLCPLQTK